MELKMIRLIVTFLIIAFFVGCNPKLNLVENGKSEYNIVISDNATEIEKKSADELKKYIYDISGVEVSIISDTEVDSQLEIVVGKTDRQSKIDFSRLEEDGFHIYTDQQRLFIAGGTDKGTLSFQ